MADRRNPYKTQDYDGGESLEHFHSNHDLNRGIEFMRRVLGPAYYVSESYKKGSIHCKCLRGHGIDDDEKWEYIFKAIKKEFGSRFQEVFHNTCYNHIDFTVYLKTN